MKRHFDPVTLRVFVAICEEGSLARAAERECLVPSSLSKRLAALEDEVGLPLINRSKKFLEPTPAGAFFLSSAREILLSMERLHLQLGEFVDRLGGNIRGVATRSALAEKLPDDVASFLTRHPHVNVRIDELLNADIPACVREGRADFGVCWVDGQPAGLDIIAYRSDQLCAVMPAHHPLARPGQLSFAETLSWPYILVQPTSEIQTLMRQHALASGATQNVRVQVSTFDAACRNVAAGLGISVVPGEIASLYAGGLGLAVVPLSDPWARRRFGICIRSREALTTPARLLVEHLADFARASEG